MTAKDFVKLFYTERNELIRQYFDNPQETEVGLELANLGLTAEQTKKIKSIINKVLRDAMYTILLGLDGEASIGRIQETYQLFDESGYKLTGSGEIEQYAFEFFHEIDS
jgi:hypothetical protein